MLIKIKVFPDSKKAGVVKKSENSFEIRVKEKAERGTANKAAITALASHLKIGSSRIRLIRGAKQRNKILNIPQLVLK